MMSSLGRAASRRDTRSACDVRSGDDDRRTMSTNIASAIRWSVKLKRLAFQWAPELRSTTELRSPFHRGVGSDGRNSSYVAL